MSAIQLLHGDCLELMRDIPAGSVDAIITDLPYGTTACHWDTVIPFAPLWAEWKRVIKPRGAVVLFGSQPFTTMLIGSNLDWFKYCLIWEKSKASNFLNARNKPMPAHEDIIVFSNGTTANGSNIRMTYNPQMKGGIPYKKLQKTDPRVGAWSAGNRTPYLNIESINNGERFPTSVLFFGNGNNFSDHPTQKPVALLEYLTRTYTNPGETVLDCTMGSGTTLVACVNTQRNGIGIELDAGYYAIAQRRIAEAQMQPALFVEAATC